MIDNLVIWLADLLQSEPKAAAAFLIALAVWNLINTVGLVCAGIDVESIKKALRKHGIWA